MADKAIMRRWVEWLRDPTHKQGTGRLHIPAGGIRNVDEVDSVVTDTDEFCCLGGLCQIAVEDGVIPRGEQTRIGGELLVAYGGNSTAFLPEKVERWADLCEGAATRDNGVGVCTGNVALIDEDGHMNSATGLNDTENYTFARIADAVERTYLADES